MSRVFANGPGNMGSISGRVKPKIQKWYLMPRCLTFSITRLESRVKCSIPGKGVAPSPTPWCSSYWKGSLWVTLDWGHHLYFYYFDKESRATTTYDLILHYTYFITCQKCIRKAWYFCSFKSQAMQFVTYMISRNDIMHFGVLVTSLSIQYPLLWLQFVAADKFNPSAVMVGQYMTNTVKFSNHFRWMKERRNIKQPRKKNRMIMLFRLQIS